MKFFAQDWFRATWFGRFWTDGEESAPSISYEMVRFGDTVEVTVTTTIADVVLYFWYLDGSYAGRTTSPTKTFQIPEGEQLRLECVPTADPDFDPIQNAPDGFSCRRTLWWIRSLDVDAALYRIEQQAADGAWTTLAEIAPDPDAWDFYLETDRLDDLTQYAWRVTPIDAAGNAGTPTTIGPERIVRWPDAPQFATAFDEETQTVEFS